MTRPKDSFTHQLMTTVFPLVIQAFMLAFISATDAIMPGLADQTSMAGVSEWPPVVVYCIMNRDEIVKPSICGTKSISGCAI